MVFLTARCPATQNQTQRVVSEIVSRWVANSWCSYQQRAVSLQAGNTRLRVFRGLQQRRLRGTTSLFGWLGWLPTLPSLSQRSALRVDFRTLPPPRLLVCSLPGASRGASTWIESATGRSPFFLRSLPCRRGRRLTRPRRRRRSRPSCCSTRSLEIEVS